MFCQNEIGLLTPFDTFLHPLATARVSWLEAVACQDSSSRAELQHGRVPDPPPLRRPPPGPGRTGAAAAG